MKKSVAKPGPESRLKQGLTSLLGVEGVRALASLYPDPETAERCLAEGIPMPRPCNESGQLIYSERYTGRFPEADK